MVGKPKIKEFLINPTFGRKAIYGSWNLSIRRVRWEGFSILDDHWWHAITWSTNTCDYCYLGFVTRWRSKHVLDTTLKNTFHLFWSRGIPDSSMLNIWHSLSSRSLSAIVWSFNSSCLKRHLCHWRKQSLCSYPPWHSRLSQSWQNHWVSVLLWWTLMQ